MGSACILLPIVVHSYRQETLFGERRASYTYQAGSDHDHCGVVQQDEIEAILFGSYARGDADPGSDIDVLLLVDASRQDISDRNWQVGDLAAELLLDHGIVVSPLVENREYFNQNLQLFPFYRSIEREGVRISA